MGVRRKKKKKRSKKKASATTDAHKDTHANSPHSQPGASGPGRPRGSGAGLSGAAAQAQTTMDQLLRQKFPPSAALPGKEPRKVKRKKKKKSSTLAVTDPAAYLAKGECCRQ